MFQTGVSHHLHLLPHKKVPLASCISLCVPLSPLPTVKYIREVSPLFKKPSLVADLPWDGVRPQSPNCSGSEDSGSPKHSSSSGPRDRKVIGLKMCFISRNLTMPDLENRSEILPCVCVCVRVRACVRACVCGLQMPAYVGV